MASTFSLEDPNLLAQLVELSIGYGVGGAASRLFDPLVQGAANAAWTESPNMPADVPTLALLRLRDLISAGDAQDEAYNTGFNPTRFARYIAANRTPPPLGEALELYRRGQVDLASLRVLLVRGGADERYVDGLLTLVRNLPSVADLAMARQQEFIGDDELHRRALEAGYSPEDADLFYRMAGLPYGIATAIELLRRGKIDHERFRQVVAEGHTKTKYTDDLLELRFQPLSAAVAAEALIRERIDEGKAVQIAAENGIDRDDFLLWSNMLGRPPGIVEALTVINRRKYGDPAGPAAHAFFRDVVARSDVRTEYADDLYELRTHYPPLFQVQRALAAGTVTKEVAADTLRKEGYPDEWVASIVNSHAKAPRHKEKDLSAAIVETLYEAGLDTHPEAVAALERLGYDEQEANQYLALWTARRLVSELVRGVTLVRGRYTTWKIDKPTAGRLLDEITNDGTYKQRAFGLWDAEREANAPVLTRAEILQAYKYDRFNLEQALERLQLLGHTAEDALTLAWIEAKGDPRPAAAP